jgi:hypothetical protein
MFHLRCLSFCVGVDAVLAGINRKPADAGRKPQKKAANVLADLVALTRAARSRSTVAENLRFSHTAHDNRTISRTTGSLSRKIEQHACNDNDRRSYRSRASATK